ncbi:hypothetical protein V8C34DRAFT_129754 [Trichoderma compactum]
MHVPCLFACRLSSLSRLLLLLLLTAVIITMASFFQPARRAPVREGAKAVDAYKRAGTKQNHHKPKILPSDGRPRTGRRMASLGLSSLLPRHNGAGVPPWHVRIQSVGSVAPARDCLMIAHLCVRRTLRQMLSHRTKSMSA